MRGERGEERRRESGERKGVYSDETHHKLLICFKKMAYYHMKNSITTISSFEIVNRKWILKKSFSINIYIYILTSIMPGAGFALERKCRIPFHVRMNSKRY